jgi:hypothetical protein
MLEHWCQIINKCWNIGPKGCNWTPKFDGILFTALGPIQGHNVQHLLVTCGRLKSLFSISALTPSVKPLELISTFAPIGMLDLGWILALTPNVKWALWSCHTLEVSLSQLTLFLPPNLQNRMIFSKNANGAYLQLKTSDSFSGYCV